MTDGGRSGFAGSPMCQRCTAESSTRATSNASPVGDHQNPRSRLSSSAATNSASPQVTPASPISSRSFSPEMSTTPRRAAADVSHPSSGRIGAWIEHRAWHRQLARRRIAVNDEQPARQGKRDDAGVFIGRIADDAGRLLAGTFAPGPLGGRNRVVTGEQFEWVGDQLFRARVRRRSATGRSPDRCHHATAKTTPGCRRRPR